MLRRWVKFIFSDGFLARASIVELAIGLVVLSGLWEVSSKLIIDIILPIIAVLVGGLSMTDKFIALNSAVTATNLADAEKQGAVLAYGDFLTSVFNFLIVLAASLLMLRVANGFLSGTASEDKKP